jgi:hypothetical protein
MFEPKIKEGTEGLNDELLHSFYSPCNIIRMITLSRIKWGHIYHQWGC